MFDILNRQQILSSRIEGEGPWFPDEGKIGPDDDDDRSTGGCDGGCDGDCACTQAW